MRTRSYRHMSDEEREPLSLGLAHGYSLRAMASVLGRAPSPLSREYARHAVRGPYRACTAHTLASARARQPRRSRTLLDPWLWQYVRTQLAEGCSPEQIAGRLQRAYPGDMREPRSAETLYAVG
ncbi:MAG: helix-turn-helix domain-containing protein [Nitrospirota bacterium]